MSDNRWSIHSDDYDPDENYIEDETQIVCILQTPILPIEGTYSYAVQAARLNRKRLAALAAWEATE
jgi:hypothetical protein